MNNPMCDCGRLHCFGCSFNQAADTGSPGEGGGMITVSFSEAAALSYIAKNKPLSDDERAELLQMMSPEARRIANTLVRARAAQETETK